MPTYSINDALARLDYLAGAARLPILLGEHNGTFEEFYYYSTFAIVSKKLVKLKEARFSLKLHCHDLTSFF